jgi:hypothetical protein
MYLRTVKVRSSSGAVNPYVRVVEAYRDNGKVKQRTVADLGRMDLLAEIFPKLKRLLGYDADSKTPGDNDPDILDASTWGPVLAVRALFADGSRSSKPSRQSSWRSLKWTPKTGPLGMLN